MEKIDSGYFYDVFDLNNGRVLKKMRSFWEIRKQKQKETKTGFIASLFETRKHIKECQRATEVIISKRKDIPQELIGNPSFVNKTDYEQDKVTTLIDYCSTHTIQESKVIIDKYIELVRLLLRYGLHDVVYKFKNSYGINKEGNLVFIDFNEITFSKEEVVRLIQNEEWKKEAQFRKQDEGEFKEYLRSRFSEVITLETINNEWGY